MNVQALGFVPRPATALAAFAATVALGIAPPVQAASNWESAGTVALPQWNYTFLSATPSGNLLAVTVNSAAADSPPKDLPALLIRNPSGPSPEVVELCRTSFAPNRGYGGIACDPSGSFFVSGDTGETATSFIRKFSENGAPDATFGTRGEIRPNRRCLGVEVFSEYLLVAMDWGRIGVFRTDNGSMIGELPKTSENWFLRDVTIDPKSLRVFGSGEGGILTWGRGTPWAPLQYDFRVLAPRSAQPRAGEGLSIDPIRRSVLISPIPGNTLCEVHGSGAIDRYQVLSAAPDTHLSDSVMSFDGTTLFISDARDRKIHRMSRRIADTGAAAQIQTVANATTGGVPSAAWVPSYEDSVRQARDAGQAMLVYFRKADVKNCADFEAGVLKTDQFNINAPGMVCVFEDISLSPLLAYKFGVYRVPHIVLLDRTGNQVAEYRHPIAPEELFKAMQSAKK